MISIKVVKCSSPPSKKNLMETKGDKYSHVLHNDVLLNKIHSSGSFHKIIMVEKFLLLSGVLML